MALSPDGQVLATPGRQSVTLRETLTWGVRRQLSLRWGSVHRLGFSPDGRRLVTDWYPTPLVWDVSLMAPVPEAPAGALAELEKDRLWATLAHSEAEPAYQAMRRLAPFPEAATALIRERLRPARAADDATLDRLLAELGNDRFAVRERAAAELDQFGETVVAGVRARLVKIRSEEVRRRVRLFLERHDSDEEPPNRLRALRAVELLEQFGGPEARAVLAELAKGVSVARLTQAAGAALHRLQRRAEAQSIP